MDALMILTVIGVTSQINKFFIFLWYVKFWFYSMYLELVSKT